MTMAQFKRRLTTLERNMNELRWAVEYQQTVEGIRRGLESLERGEGESVRMVFSRMRRKHKSARSR